METTKKPNGGYGRLKVKYDKALKQIESMKDDILVTEGNLQNATEAFKKLKKDYEAEQAKSAAYLKDYQKALGWCAEKDRRIEFLLDHAPFWVRWVYKRHFVKGGE